MMGYFSETMGNSSYYHKTEASIKNKYEFETLFKSFLTLKGKGEFRKSCEK